MLPSWSLLSSSVLTGVVSSEMTASVVVCLGILARLRWRERLR